MVVNDVFITRVVVTILTAERTFWTQVTLVGLDFTSLMRLRTEQALNFSKQATLKLSARLIVDSKSSGACQDVTALLLTCNLLLVENRIQKRKNIVTAAALCRGKYPSFLCYKLDKASYYLWLAQYMLYKNSSRNKILGMAHEELANTEDTRTE